MRALFQLLVLGGILLLFGCRSKRHYYIGNDRSMIESVLGGKLPTNSIGKSWIQLLEFPEDDILTSIVKIELPLSDAEQYCKLIGMQSFDVKEISVQVLPLNEKDSAEVSTWWDPPKLADADAAFGIDETVTGEKRAEVRAVWHKGYLYVHKKIRPQKKSDSQ